MRLIDLDELEKFPIRADHYDKKNGNIHFICGIETLMEYAESLPVFDLDKVIEQLEDKAIEELGITKSQFDMDRSEYSSCCSLCLGDVVEIIKKGGIK